MFKSELFQYLLTEYVKYSLNHPDDTQIKSNVNDLLENINEKFKYFINESGVFLCSYIISHSEAKERKALIKELLSVHEEKQKYLY